MAKLWKKKGQNINPLVEKYTAGTDYLFDVELMPFDIAASRAHATALNKIHILSASELKAVIRSLNALEKAWKKGEIAIAPEDEDCHTVIENYLVASLGPTGKKVHTGRSRNDQVLVATRLYLKSHLVSIRQEALKLAGSFLTYAETNRDVPMPGYTHTQQAMLSSIGHYMSSFAESLADDAAFAASAISHLDRNPLGTAAGFGTSFPIDRALTARDLGFKHVQVNSLYAQNSRGKFESAYMEALAQIMMTLGRWAHDMLIFTSQEFDFFRADDSLVTGSSIMPQKRNLDVLEIMRGNVSVVTSNQFAVKEITKNLLSGYNRDLQLIKKPLMESTFIVRDSLTFMGVVLKGISPNDERMRAALQPGIFAADIANDLVNAHGIPFRDAYAQAMGLVPEYSANLGKNLASKVSLGAPGNLALKALRARLKKEARSHAPRRSQNL